MDSAPTTRSQRIRPGKLRPPLACDMIKDMTELLDSPDQARADKLAYYLIKAVNKAVRHYRLLADGDVILVAVSGGKDSMTLLDLLYRRQQMAREQYQMIAAHVRTDMHCGRAVPIDWLQGWCAERGVPLVIQDLAVAEEVATTTMSRCFRCAWNRRKTLFQMADQWGCNKLAFGHHADDIAETTLMNLFYTANLRPMEPKMDLFGGRLVAIRPLAYVEERDIVPFVRASGFPVQGEPCPEGVSSRRAVIKRILRELESENHAVKRHIYRAVDRYQQALQHAVSGAPKDAPKDDAAEADLSQAAM